MIDLTKIGIAIICERADLIAAWERDKRKSHCCAPKLSGGHDG